MIQPEYNSSSNEELYPDNHHYAGAQNSNSDQGLTNKGNALIKAYIKHGGMIDASHTKDQTFIDMLSISEELQETLGVPVPVFLNHANIDATPINNWQVTYKIIQINTVVQKRLMKYASPLKLAEFGE